MNMIRMIATGAALAASVLAYGSHTDAQEAASDAKVKASRIFSATTTANGQPIKLPQSNAEVVVWMYDIPVGAKLAVHKHPFPRYAYVLQGTLQVTDVENSRTWHYKPGDFIVEIVDAWHYGATTGSDPVRLLVIDQVDKGQANTILRY
jgi:quercetin dioxygenase-like cupin family protein